MGSRECATYLIHSEASVNLHCVFRYGVSIVSVDIVNVHFGDFLSLRAQNFHILMSTTSTLSLILQWEITKTVISCHFGVRSAGLIYIRRACPRCWACWRR